MKGELGVPSFHLGAQQQLWVSPMWEISPHSCYPVNFSYFVILAKLSKRSFPDVWETGWTASTALGSAACSWDRGRLDTWECRPSASSNAKKGLLLVPQQQFYLICAHCSFQIKTCLFIVINNWRVGKYSLRQEAALEVKRCNGSCSRQQN